jgi:hypothetical protein
MDWALFSVSRFAFKKDKYVMNRIVLSGFATLAAALATIGSSPALAHAFGQRYDLPAPLWMYLGGAGAAVAFSFAVMALTLRRNVAAASIPSFELSSTPLGRWLTHRAVLALLRICSVAIFILILATGFFGIQSPIKNFAPTMVWVIWWIGLAMISALLGDFWRVINPWRVIFAWGEMLVGREVDAKPDAEKLGAWPAVALFAVFAWLELISEIGESPRQLSYLIVIYSMITWWGMAIYGREAWLQRGEAFTVAFSLFARFAPTGVGANNAWVLRPPAADLLTERPMHPSVTVFVLLILSTVTFDGFLETPAWGAVLEWVSEDATLRPLLLALQENGMNLLKAIKTSALVIFPLIFMVAYLMFCALMTWAGGSIPMRDVVGYFVLSLVPIAIAYHIAHYLSYLLLAGQLIIALVSDPFGFGWDLFGTADFKIDIGIVTAKFVWYLSVTTIVVGHLVAVYLAHIMALRVFPTMRAAMRSQIPMMVLMVGYTMISLWILSQPVVESGLPGQ